MKRITIRLTEAQVNDLDEMVDEGVFPNRSEAIRTGVRDLRRMYVERPHALPDGGAERDNISDAKRLRTARTNLLGVDVSTSPASRDKQTALDCVNRLLEGKSTGDSGGETGGERA